MYQVYVMVNKMNRRFIATAESPEDELVQHNKGEFKWTAQFRPWSIEWTGQPMSRRDADRLEKKLVPFKTNPGALHNLMDENSDWKSFDEE